MIDLRLNESTHDLEITAFDLSLVGPDDLTEYTAQKLKIRLWFFLGEWFLDTAEGVPYFQEILVKNPKVPRIETILKARIIGSPNVTELISFATEFNNGARTFDVDFQARTTTGDVVTISETVP